jgi:DNA-binding protein YbaB
MRQSVAVRLGVDREGVGRVPDADAAISATEKMLAEMNRAAQEKATQFQAVADRAGQASVTEVSKDGAIRITVGSNGVLTKLEISERAGQHGMSAVATEIMRLIQRAQGRIPELLTQISAEVGASGAGVAHMLAQAKDWFPEPPPEPVLPGAGSPGREMRLDAAEPVEEPPPPPPPARPKPDAGRAAPQRQRPESTSNDDGDFGDESVMQERPW